MSQDMDEANIESLDEYLMAFYEENSEIKIAASRKILILTLDMKNIEYLINHDSLMGTICRTLKDDHKKSMDLCIYLQCIFFIFSNYQDFHQMLLQNQNGDATMKIIEYQIQRFDIRLQEYSDQEKYCKLLMLDKKNPTTENKQKLENELKKLNRMIAKQDKLLYICFTILLNLAEDFSIEKKMKKRKIVVLLVRMLERNDFHLLIIALLFLRKLSIVGTNKMEENIIQRMGRFFSCNNNILLQLSLGVLKNLCFDSSIREQIEQAGYIPKIIDLLKISNYRFMAINILYLLTIDERIRTTFSYTDCMTLIVKLIVHFPEPQVGKELIAIGINLSANKKNAEKTTEDELQKMIDRGLQNEDVCIFKFVKNIAFNSTLDHHQDCLTAYLPDFLKTAMTQGHNDDLKIELLGIMGNIRIGKEWEEFCNQSFIEFLSQNLTVGAVEDDILLESIMLCANLADNKLVAEILSEKKLFRKFVQILYEKAEDDEIVTQTLFVLYQFLKHGLEIEYSFSNETFQLQLLNMIHVKFLFQEKNSKIRKMNDKVIDILREYNQEIQERVKERRFYQHNKEWIESMEDYEKNFMGGDDHMNMQNDPNYMNPALMEQQDDNELNHAQIDPRMWDDSEEDD